MFMFILSSLSAVGETLEGHLSAYRGCMASGFLS